MTSQKLNFRPHRGLQLTAETETRLFTSRNLCTTAIAFFGRMLWAGMLISITAHADSTGGENREAREGFILENIPAEWGR